jgi:hypothetical protein
VPQPFRVRPYANATYARSLTSVKVNDATILYVGTRQVRPSGSSSKTDCCRHALQSTMQQTAGTLRQQLCCVSLGGSLLVAAVLSRLPPLCL